MEAVFQIFESQRLTVSRIVVTGRVLQDLTLGDDLCVNNNEEEIFRITKITAYSKSLEKISSGMTCSLELAGGAAQLEKYTDLLKIKK